MNPRRWVCLTPALLLSLTRAAAALPEIRGEVYSGNRGQPVPGALVALYDAGDLMLDVTYTRDDGAFRLQSPQSKGRFYVIATGEGTSRRAEFDYDPALGRTRQVSIRFPATEKSAWRRAGGWLRDELGAVVGLLLGYMFRVVVEERLAARGKRDTFLSDLRAAAEQALSRFPSIQPETKLTEITAGVSNVRRLLDQRRDTSDALSALALLPKEKEKARGTFRALLKKLQEAEGLLAAAPSLPSNPQREKLERVKQILLEIRDRPLG